MPKQIFFIFLLMFAPCLAIGQHKFLPARKNAAFTKADDDCMDRANQCLNSHRYNAKQRRTFFPFNGAASVKLISFQYMLDKGEPVDENNRIGYRGLFTAIRPGEFVVDYAQVEEYKALSPQAIDSLTDILYNINFRPLKCRAYIANEGMACYEPRNAILFLDKNGKVSQYMEICFACQRHRYSSVKFKQIDYCESKYDMLCKFFAAQGIAYGTASTGIAD